MNNLNAENISPKLWAKWLSNIKIHPEHHKFIARVNGKFEFIDSQSKEYSPKNTLKSTEISEISKSILSRKDVNLRIQEDILSGLEYIINKRESNFRKLGFISLIFAKLIGTQNGIKHEKSELEKLKIELKKNKFLSVQKDIQDFTFKKQRGRLSAKNRPQMNEVLFKHAVYLYELRKHLPADEQGKIKELEKQLYLINPHIPKIKTLVQLFGPFVIKDSLKKMVELICDAKSIKQEELERDCKLFSCDRTEMQARYVQHQIKAFRTGYSCSTVTAIERTWQEMLNWKQVVSEERKINEHHVIFIPPQKDKQGEVYIKEKFLDKGSFKAVFLATPFFDTKKAQSRGKMTVLQPLEALRDQVQAQRKRTKKQVSPVAFSSNGSAVISSEKCKSPETIKKKMGKKGESLEVEYEKEETEASGTAVIKDEEFSGTVEIHQDMPSDELEEKEEMLGTVEIKNKSPTGKWEKEENGVEQSDEQSDTSKKEKTHLHDSLPISSQSSDPVRVKKLRDSKVLKREKQLQKEAEKEDYKREAALCLELQGLPGIWLTHKVTEINGETAIIQKAAGYAFKTSKGEIKKGINLQSATDLIQENKLSVYDQIVVLNMFRDFLKGVQTLHHKGIIHRDIKPENVLCSSEGQGGLTDFGACCRDEIPDPRGNGSLIPDPDKSRLIGSNYYFAPEVPVWTKTDKDWEKIKPSADIWSIGIMLWEMFTGKENFTHPAIKQPSAIAFSTVSELIKDKKSLEAYNNHFKKPHNEMGILSLIWNCNRVNPDERMNIDSLIEKYETWSKEMIRKLNAEECSSFNEAFLSEVKAELEKEEIKSRF